MQARRLRQTTAVDFVLAREVRRLLAAAETRNTSWPAALDPTAAPAVTGQFQWQATARDGIEVTP